MIRNKVYVLSLILLAVFVSGGKVFIQKTDNDFSDKAKKVKLSQPAGDSLYQKEMVYKHLYDIYQQPPPLQKTWPPASLKEWENTRDYYIQAISDMLNLPSVDKKSDWPLNLRFTKPDLNRIDFTVKYIAYQSRPDFWVTANLYIPDNIMLPAPTVMVLHGHSDTGKSTEKYQVLIQNLLKKGYVVLFKDGIGTGERTYTNHNYGIKAPFTYMSGISLEGLETWDNIRAIDMLSSDDFKQWVDKERIGVAGMSGGSMQAFYLTLMDERIKTAAMVCQRNTYTAEFKLWGHCICCVCATGIRRKAEQYHMVATIAPRPVIICNGTHDPNHPLEGAINLVNEAKKVYALYGKEADLELVVDDVPHEFSLKFRRAAYSLFNKYLKVDATDLEEPVIPLTKEQLDCGLPEESTARVSTIVYTTSLELPYEKGVYNTPEKFETYRRSLISTIRNEVFGYNAYMPGKCDLDAKVVKRTDAGKNVREIISFKSEPDISLNAEFSYPENKKNLPVIITLESGEDVSKYMDAGYAVLSLALRPDAGDIKRYGANWGAWARGMSCGKPSTGMRIYDILRSVDYLETRTDLIDKNRIGCIGSQPLNAMYTLYAAALDPRIRSVVMEDLVTTYKPSTEDISGWYAWNSDMYIPQILLHADVSQVASLCSPKPVLIVGGRDIANKVLSPEEVKENLYSCLHTYKLLNKENNLSFQPPENTTDYIKWFDASLSR